MQPKSRKNEPTFIVVLPGDNVTEYIIKRKNDDDIDDNNNNHTEMKKNRIVVVYPPPKLGHGLRYDESTKQIYATIAGRLDITTRRINNNNNTNNITEDNNNNNSMMKTTPTTSIIQMTCWIRTNKQRYYKPAIEDRIIGIIEDRIGSDGHGGDYYRVNINSSHPAMISNLSSFECATKRNKPSLQQGQIFYTRIQNLGGIRSSGGGGNNVGNNVSSSCVDDGNFLVDPMLSCMLGPHDIGIPRKDWMTNEGCYGELRGGTICKISIGLARELLHPDNIVLYELSKQQSKKYHHHQLAFEIAIGVNGFLWIHSTKPEYTILIQNCIQQSEILTENQIRTMITSSMYAIEKQIQREYDSSSSTTTTPMTYS